MPVYTIYLQNTGQILAQIIGRLTYGRDHLGNGIYEGAADPLKDWINPETKKAESRPTMEVTVGDSEVAVDEYFRVDNIPEGTELSHPGDQQTTIDDGFFEWTTDIPGTYEFTLTKFPYMPVTVNATFS